MACTVHSYSPSHAVMQVPFSWIEEKVKTTANHVGLTDIFDLYIKGLFKNKSFKDYLVIIIGSDLSVKKFMKQWRITKVDVDKQGRPCLERMMSVIFEGTIDNSNLLMSEVREIYYQMHHLEWDVDTLHEFIDSIGSEKWVSICKDENIL